MAEIPLAVIPERVGVCPNRIGDSGRYLGATLILVDGEPAICEHCGAPLIVYTRERVEPEDAPARPGSNPSLGPGPSRADSHRPGG